MLYSLRLAALPVALAFAAAPASAATILINFASAPNGITIEMAGEQARMGGVQGSILIDTAAMPANQPVPDYNVSYDSTNAPFLTTSITYSGGTGPGFPAAPDAVTNILRAMFGPAGTYEIKDERSRQGAMDAESGALSLTYNGATASQTIDGVVLPVFAIGQLLNFSLLNNSQTFDADGFPVDARNSEARGDVTVTAVTVNGATPAVPEPATWATMVLGFGLAGAAVRRRHAARFA